MSLFVGVIAAYIVSALATLSPGVTLTLVAGASLFYLYVKVVNEID